MHVQVFFILVISMVGLLQDEVQGQNSSRGELASVFGFITDAETGSPLSLAHVKIDPINSGSITDEQGRYELKGIPEGLYAISVSSLGYSIASEDSVMVTEGDPLEINFQLELTTIETNEVVITASRRAQVVSMAPASVAMVHAEEIQSQNLQTFDQAFDGLVGVQVTRSSGSNVQALSIRGSSEVAGGGIGNRVLLLIDGRPALSPESGGALWNLVPLQSIDRIEVVKGAYSSLFGSSAMGGVINVITKNPVERSSTQGHFNFGFYDRAPIASEYSQVGKYFTAELSHSGVVGKWKYLVDAGRKSNDGHREKSAFDINHLFGKLVYRANTKDKWTLSGNFNQIKNDAPATWLNSRLAYTVAPHRRDDFQDKKEYNMDLNYQSLRSGHLKYDTRVYYYRNYSNFSFNDTPNNRTDSNINFGKQSIDKESVAANRIGASFQADYHVPNHYLIVGSDIKRDFVNGLPDTVLYGRHQSISAGIFVQDEIPLGDQIIATLGLRYDYFHLGNSFSESNFSPKLAAVWQSNDQLSFRFLFAQAFRNPSMAERFIKFEQGGGLRFEPNPDLRAERLTSSYEFGSIWKMNQSISLDIAFFHNRYRDLISFRQLPEPSGALLYKVVNLNKAIMQGIDVQIKSRIKSFAQVGLGYSLLDARDVSDNKLNSNLAYKIKHSVNASLHLSYRALSLNVSGRFRSAIKEVFIYPGSEPGAYSLLNAKLSYEFLPQWSAYLATNNIANTRYEELERYRMPGRSFTLGLRFGI